MKKTLPKRNPPTSGNAGSDACAPHDKEKSTNVSREITGKSTAKRRTLRLVLCSLFTALITVGAFIRIPVSVVPITLQTLFVLLAGLLLGKKTGTAAVLIYIALGLVGVPVFTAGGGFSYVLQPTFGYILGFALGAFVAGSIVEKSSASTIYNKRQTDKSVESAPLKKEIKKQPTYGRLLIASLAGLAVIYALGLAYFYLISKFYLHTFSGAWNLRLTGFLFTVPGDIALCFLCALLAKKLIPFLSKTTEI